MIQRRAVGDHSVILEITLDACSAEQARRLREQIVDHCEEIAFQDNVRALVLVYSGGVFGGSPEDLERYGHGGPLSVTDVIGRLPQPVLAVIRGDAIGPGLEIALACDLRFGTPGARFGLPQVRSGLLPQEGGTQRLGRLIGQARALELLLTGDALGSDEALRLGLLTRVVEPGALVRMAERMACKIERRSPVAVSYVKEALRKGVDLPLDQGLRMELDLYLLLFSTHDRTEGITAFLEKRVPDFTGE